MKRLVLASIVGLVLSGNFCQRVAAQSNLEQPEPTLEELIAPPRPDIPQATSEPGYLGLFAEDAGGLGVVVSSVKPDGPAEAAGVKPGDTIIAINGAVVRSLDDLGAALQGQGVGSRVEIAIFRSSRLHMLTVTLGRHSLAGDAGGDADSPDNILPQPLPPDAQIPPQRPLLGISVSSVNQAARRRFNLTIRRGAIIISIIPGSPADRYGLPVGGLIVSVGARQIDSPDDLVAVISAAQPGDSVEISYYQEDKLFHKTVRLAPPPIVIPPTPRREARRPIDSDSPLRLVPPGEDWPTMRRLEALLDLALTPHPAEQPLADREEIGLLRRQVQLLQEHLERTERRVLDLEKRLHDESP